MTSPIREVQVLCPGPACGRLYWAFHRASVNLDLDDFSDEYLAGLNVATCDFCDHVVRLETLIVRGEVWRARQARRGGL